MIHLNGFAIDALKMQNFTLIIHLHISTSIMLQLGKLGPTFKVQTAIQNRSLLIFKGN